MINLNIINVCKHRDESEYKLYKYINDRKSTGILCPTGDKNSNIVYYSYYAQKLYRSLISLKFMVTLCLTGMRL